MQYRREKCEDGMRGCFYFNEWEESGHSTTAHTNNGTQEEGDWLE